MFSPPVSSLINFGFGGLPRRFVSSLVPPKSPLSIGFGLLYRGLGSSSTGLYG